MRSHYGTDFREETLTYPFRRSDTWMGTGKLVGMPTANMKVSDESTLSPAGG